MVELKLRKLENGLDPKKVSLISKNSLRLIRENGKDLVLFHNGKATENDKKILNYMFKGVIYGENRVLIPKEYFYL